MITYKLIEFAGGDLRFQRLVYCNFITFEHLILIARSNHSGRNFWCSLIFCQLERRDSFSREEECDGKVEENRTTKWMKGKSVFPHSKIQSRRVKYQFRIGRACSRRIKMRRSPGAYSLSKYLHRKRILTESKFARALNMFRKI